MAERLAIRDILFPTDLSDASERAGRTALDFARHFGARLHLLHVVPPVTDPTPAAEALAAVLKGMPRDVPVASQVAFGLAARQIIGYARRTDIDLIVMGTHGRTGVSHALLGSVAEAVIRRAPCRVLVVPNLLGDAAVVAPETPETEVRCLVCQTLSPEVLCDPCRVRIRTEAMKRELRHEKTAP